VHGPIRAAACFASLHRAWNTVFHRTLADSVEAVFILIAFRRFAQFSDDQRERTTTPATKKPAATIMTKVKHDLRRYPVVSRSPFVPIHAFALFNRRIY
jgi:hypothetical protein